MKTHQKIAATIAAFAITAVPLQAAGDEDFGREQDLSAKEGKPAPALKVENWINTPDGKPLALADLKGKVVVIDFWGTWWGPCIGAVPHLKELAESKKDAGLVIIGVHSTRGAEKMAGFVKTHSIGYPVAVDVDKQTVSAFGGNSYPDYFVIDRKGVLRFADLKNAELDAAVEYLLAEK